MSKTSSAESYRLKWVKWRGNHCPIVTQNENGPCPLIAIINFLLLKNRITLPSLVETVTPSQLMEYLGDCILENVPKNLQEEDQLNFEQNMHDAIAILPKLSTGLDVNVKFAGVSDFEYTPELIVFDLLHIPLYHGWLVDPENVQVVSAIGSCSYNQLVDKIITNKSSFVPESVLEAQVGEEFLEKTASQLTYYGLSQLSVTIKEDEICVLFRNNHFVTLFKHKGQLYQLVTDQGFITESKVVWETLNNIDNNGEFVDGDFVFVPPKPMMMTSEERQLQVDHDYLVALSLEEEQKKIQMEWGDMKDASHLSDEELARKLQEEEKQKHEEYLSYQEKKSSQHYQQDQPQSDQKTLPSSPITDQRNPSRNSSHNSNQSSSIKKSNSKCDDNSNKSKCSLM